MLRKSKIISLILTVVLLFPVGCSKSNTSENSSDTIDLQLLTFNDLHGQFDADEEKGGGIANLAAYLKKYKAENKNTIIMSAGDQLGASPIITALKQDQPTLEIMEAMGVDVVTTGNHAFDEGVDELGRIIYGGTHSSGLEWQGSESLNWITANVVAKEDMQFGTKTIKKGEPILNPYLIKEISGVKVGIIGIVTVDTAKKAIPEGIKSVEFVDEVTTINKYSKELTSDGVKTIIVLSHVPALTNSDTGELVDLAESSDIYDISQKVDGEVDVIVAADNHEYANSVISRKNKDDIVVVEAYSKGTSISKIDLTIDKSNGDVLSSNSDIIKVDPSKVTADAEVEKIVEETRKEVQPLLERKIGYAKEFIQKDIQNGNGESELGRLVADSQLWATKQDDDSIDIALMNIGGVRADIDSGDITYEDIYSVQPFSNDLTKVSLSGAQLKSILEEQNITDWVIGLKQDAYNRPYMLQVAGFTYKWHPEKADDNYLVKVDEMYLKDAKKTKITDTTNLNVAVNIFIAQGGDGFETFASLPYTVIMNDLDAFEKYVEVFSTKDNNGDGKVGLSKPNLKTDANIINSNPTFE